MTFEIPDDDAPALYYLGTDDVLRRLDFDPRGPLAEAGGEWVLDMTDRERALCEALLALVRQRMGS